MADPFIGEIRLFGFGIVPQGWATCDGQTLTIQQNQALFSLLSNRFGGDGKTNFKLPDYRGRTLLHCSATYPEGTAGGSEGVALAALSQLPAHTHALTANTVSGSNLPQGQVLATVGDATCTAYATAKATPAANLATTSLASTGGSAAHTNLQPSLTVNYCISLTGIYPPRS